ncbi:peptidyl-prolyl cis-trans isomerase [Streptomyces sp. WI04-05B]|uniref:peptidyl-prolyl cis-trans isomerase n=1 Tax=Streptomyces TaxID=1883 RepID=UPI0029BF62CA|nr:MULTISPECIES: peptidyl-prolyl cis-trans isomerase [unclassified Streptomyces]MDX2542432.1 peptidyl-prolyl cis-trans isomerase [Streptomyces sp. WI04-05B]MDX2582549.1 peptidyl-prolyl cis-trans isomerase [Streptomyces sp. WI04-05A]MDX3747961.1 peptidyl-prolyl cis-trans isomerase [Streptomyces sp. AK08-02]
MNEHLPEDTCAVVGGKPIPREEVEALLAAVPARDAPYQGRGELRDQPPRTRSQSTTPSAVRQRRRWATQIVVADALARQACMERALPCPDPPRTLGAVPQADVAGLGSIIAVVLAYSPAAQTLLTHLEARQEIPERAVREYYEHNRDRFLTVDALRSGVDPFGASTDTDFLPYEHVKAGVEGELRQAAGRWAFFSWLDLARADVVYAPGHEHPGDPSHPDHEHRH